MLGHAAHRTNLHAVVVVFECTTHCEEHWADDSVSEHHEQSRSPAHWLHGSDADEDDTHVRHRGVCDHLLEVGLSQTDNGTPNEGNHTEDHQRQLEVLQRMREHAEWETEHTVSTHFEHHTGKQHRTTRWCLNVRIGQPSVEGDRWQLHKETKHEHDEEHFLHAFSHKPSIFVGHGCTLNERWNVEGASGHCAVLTARSDLIRLHEVEGHKTEQHHNRGCEGVDEELLRSVLSVLATPVQDQEEHWNQCQFPEHIEHEQVKGHEHTNQSATHQEKGWEVCCTVFLVPCSDDGHWKQESGQPNHWE